MVLTKVLEISLQGSLLIIIMILCSFTVLRNIQSKYKKLLWLFIALRFLFFIQIDIFPNFIEIPIENYIETERDTVIREQISERKQLLYEQGMMEVKKDDMILYKKQYCNEWEILEKIYITGVIILLLYYFVNYYIFLYKIKRYGKKCENKELIGITNEILEELKIKKKLQLIIWENSNKSPFLMGILQPRLILPTEKYLEQDIHYIIRHELIHYKQKDILYKMFLILVHIFHWFNPLVLLMKKCLEQEIELTCDEEVIKNMGKKDRKEYSEVILSCIEAGSKAFHFSTGYANSIQFLKIRFSNILQDVPKKEGKIFLLFGLLVIGISYYMVGIEEKAIYKIANDTNTDIQSGIELNIDIDGDNLLDNVRVYDVVMGNEAYTNIISICGNGERAEISFEGHCVSELISGDINSDGLPELVVKRLYYISNYGGCDVNILYYENGAWKEYAYEFYNKNGEVEFILNAPWTGGVIEARLLNKNDRVYLRLIYYTMANDTAKCIDSYLYNGRWYIEEEQIVEDYFKKNKSKDY